MRLLSCYNWHQVFFGGESYETWCLAARSVSPSGHSWCRSAPVAPCDEFCPFSAPDATVLEVGGGGGLLACTSRGQGTRRRDASKGSPARQVCLCRFPLHVPALTLAPRDPREGSGPQPALPLPTFPGKGRELQAPWGGGTAKVARADHAEFHRMTTCLLRPGEPCQALALCSAERRRAWAAR